MSLELAGGGDGPSAGDEIDRLSRAAREVSGRGRKRAPHNGEAAGRPIPHRRITSRTRARTSPDEDYADDSQPARGGVEHPEVARYLDMLNPDRDKVTTGNRSIEPPDPSTFGQRTRGPWSSYSNEP